MNPVSTGALFPLLIGPGFDALHPLVQRAHGGAGGDLRGTASIQRGPALLARMACVFAGLPAAQSDVAANVEIRRTSSGETWTRHFGSSAAMRSTLHAQDGRLVERLGLATLSYSLQVRDGGIDWILVRIAACGIPLPLRLFDVSARSDARGDRYHFRVAAGLRGVGLIIRYEGELAAVSP